MAHTSALNRFTPFLFWALGVFFFDGSSKARDVESSFSNFRVLAAWTEAQRSQVPESQVFDSSTLFFLWTPYEHLNESFLIQPQVGVFPYFNASEDLLSLGTELSLSAQVRVWRALALQWGAGLQGWLLYDRRRSASALSAQLGLVWDLNPAWYKVRSLVFQVTPFFFLNEKPLVFPQAMQYRAGLEFEF